MEPTDPNEMRRLYAVRLGAERDYRQALWRVLVQDFFQRWIRETDTVLDLGCGYGDFIRPVRCAKKFALDINPAAREQVGGAAECFVQDCSQTWPVAADSLDVVFTSNFFEHLTDKSVLGRVLDECRRCLVPGGRLIALGPNIKYLPGAYWDFWDHHLPLTARSLTEALVCRGLAVEHSWERFLPYTAVRQPRYPLWWVRLYLRCHPAWRLFGKQFLLVARKPTA